eukprot:TRINITY_DN503_c0_g1_i10.p1 TRINITY_DN503_c0_g1~~TRINITY_DN503_c0_g1_i10.p1  ORF type:complete len:288 (+),score=74.76 TRINITY_DN503_c0_g1_i10:1548-2411(+)
MCQPVGFTLFVGITAVATLGIVFLTAGLANQYEWDLVVAGSEQVGLKVTTKWYEKVVVQSSGNAGDITTYKVSARPPLLPDREPHDYNRTINVPKDQYEYYRFQFTQGTSARVSFNISAPGDFLLIKSDAAFDEWVEKPSKAKDGVVAKFHATTSLADWWYNTTETDTYFYTWDNTDDDKALVGDVQFHVDATVYNVSAVQLDSCSDRKCTFHLKHNSNERILVESQPESVMGEELKVKVTWYHNGVYWGSVTGGTLAAITIFVLASLGIFVYCRPKQQGYSRVDTI